jgi:hypothetical protein
MGYGFTISNNPCDFYTVQMGVPLDSPLAWAKSQQKQLNDENRPSNSEQRNVLNTVGELYILTFSHPLRKQGALEHSIFSQQLLDNLSILCANDLELEHLTVSKDRCYINLDPHKNGQRNLLNTLTQLLQELQARLEKLKKTMPIGGPANWKQSNAKTYRDGNMGILETGTAVIEYCLRRAIYSSFEDSGGEKIVVEQLGNRLSESAREKLKKALMYEKNITKEGVLFTHQSSKSLLPQRYGDALDCLWEDVGLCRDGMGIIWSTDEDIWAWHAFFICCVRHLLRHGLVEGSGSPFGRGECKDGERREEQLKGARRLEVWMEEILERYPEGEPVGGGYIQDMETCIPRFLEVFEKVQEEGREWGRQLGNTSKDPVYGELRLGLVTWDRERVVWAWRVVEEEGVNVPLLEYFGERMRDRSGDWVQVVAGGRYHLHIPQLPE